MTATGLGRHTKEPIGYHHTTNESNSLRVIGAETAVELSMIIIGIVDEIETGSTIETETTNMVATETTIGIGTTGTITTATATATANRRRWVCETGYTPLGLLSNKGRAYSRVNRGARSGAA